jgi:hypothetical protein
VSDVPRRLKRGAQELKGLHDDLHPPTFARQDWRSTVFARRSLGDGVPVELWYLAEHFLLAWNDWRGLRGRYLACFGQPVNRFPANWDALDKRCKGLAERILRDERLDEIIHESWITAPGLGSSMAEQGDHSPRPVYHATVTNHRRLDLLLTASTWEEGGPEEPERTGSRNTVWPRCLNEARQLNHRLMSLWNELPPEVREPCLWHLRQYRRANLLVSWLVNGATPDTEDDGSSLFRASAGSAGWFGSRVGGGWFGAGVGSGGGGPPGPDVAHGRSALLQLLSERIVTPSIEQYLSQFQDADLRGTASHVLGRITEAIGEIGYDEFVEDVSSKDFSAGPSSLVGASSIDLIPSQVRGPCQPLLLAVSKGDKKAIGFPTIMRQVREHLIRCPATLSVIVLCDHWAPSMLEEHLGDLRAQHARGARFLFLMVGIPGRVVAPVAVDLAATP